ncbi:MAG: dTMP kinase [Deltaproteobacteria bacterium]|nr:MAG: dTMP kinase [Deltaproteobacteria bacterium]
MKRGSLVVLEGLDGSGKSTQAAALVQVLLAAGHDVVATREPTDGPYGRRIRAMAASHERVPADELLHWFQADRREHVARVIAPALAAARVVVSDRYYLSSVAYQGALGLDPAEILRQSEAEFPQPDLALLLEIPPSAGLERARSRPDPDEPAFEQREFLERVADIYHRLDRPYLVRIDARGGEAEVHAAVVTALRERLDLLGPGPASAGTRGMRSSAD